MPGTFPACCIVSQVRSPEADRKFTFDRRIGDSSRRASPGNVIEVWSLAADQRTALLRLRRNVFAVIRRRGQRGEAPCPGTHYSINLAQNVVLNSMLHQCVECAVNERFLLSIH